MKDIMQIAGLYLLLINGVGFLLMGIDKRRAKRGAWRISEKSLFLPPLLGGTVGAILGMRVFHHKTKHWYFRYGLPALLVLQLALAGCPERAGLPYHRMLLDGELPLTIGGGIGQSRLCMVLLHKAHIGEVQASIWDKETTDACAADAITLL